MIRWFVSSLCPSCERPPMIGKYVWDQKFKTALCIPMGCPHCHTVFNAVKNLESCLKCPKVIPCLTMSRSQLNVQQRHD